MWGAVHVLRRNKPKDRRQWSVGAQLSAIVGTVVLVLIAVGAAISIRDFSDARGEAFEATSFQAELATREIATSIDEARGVVTRTAAEADLPAVIAAPPEECALAGGATGIFRTGHLDIVAADGTVVCSSVQETGAPAGATYAGSRWIEQVAKGSDPSKPMVSSPFSDPLSDKLSVVVAAPVRAEGTLVGSFAVVLHLDDLAPALRDRLGGPDGYAFLVTAPQVNAAISSSTAPERAGTALTGTGFAGVQVGTRPDLDGARRLFGASEVEGLGWRVFAGLDETTAFARAWEGLRDRLVLAGAALIAAIALGLLFHRRVARPLRRLRAAIEQAGRAVNPEPVAVRGPAEVADLVREFNRTIEARARYEEQIAHNQLHDSLTGLPNRLLFLDRANLALKRARRNPESLAVLFVDVDRFKVVNDGMGHDAGDRALVEVASRIREVVRPGDTVARFGGDKFVALCENVRSRDQVAVIADRIHRAVSLPLETAGERLALTVSIGITMGGNHGTVAEDLLRDADAATARAKELGHAQHVFFDDLLRSRMVARFDLERDLRLAVEHGDLRIQYQPEVSFESGRIVAAEALVRWRHPRHGNLPPLRFLPIAEETGLIHPIGLFVLREACRQTALWTRAGHRIVVSVNFSASQLAGPDVPEAIAKAIADSGIRPDQLCIEITEGTLLDEASPVAAVLDEISAMGVKVSIDDFGTGYSSLAYLERFRVDQLKIDRAFVDGLGSEPTKSAMVAAIVEMARALHLEVVAEGIEDRDQLDELERLGVHTGQGYYFAPPQSPRQVTQLLRAGPATPAAASA